MEGELERHLCSNCYLGLYDYSSVHLEEAGILRAGPGGPDQQWPTVSSATPGKEPGSPYSCLDFRNQSDNFFCEIRTVVDSLLIIFFYINMIFIHI